jgi:hypothetical protein
VTTTDFACSKSRILLLPGQERRRNPPGGRSPTPTSKAGTLACLQPRADQRNAFGGIFRAKALLVFLGLIVGGEGMLFRGPVAMECGQGGEYLQMAIARE